MALVATAGIEGMEGLRLGWRVFTVAVAKRLWDNNNNGGRYAIVLEMRAVASRVTTDDASNRT